MSELASPRAVAGIIAVAAVHAVALGLLLALLQDGRTGFFERNGKLRGWAICLGVCLLFSILGVLSVPLIVLVALWFLIALTVLGLTTRQMLKLNVAQAVIYLLLVFATLS